MREEDSTGRLKQRVSESRMDYNSKLRHELRDLRTLCADPSHACCILSLMDATRLWREANEDCISSSRGEMLWWARRAAIKAAILLDESSVGRSPLHDVKGELSREYIHRSICGLLNEIGPARRPPVPLPRSWHYE